MALAAGPSRAAAGKVAPPRYLETPPGAKPRVVITADPELDDSNSLVRYLLYAPSFRTEGLIYASSQFHWKGDGKGTKGYVAGREYTRVGREICPCTSWRWDPKERFIDAALDAYAKAYPNLRVHDPAYPTPTALRSKVRWGNVDFDGEMDKDTPGSNLIKALLLDKEEAPIYLHAWGGQSTIARALKSIEEQYKGTPQWAAIRAKVIRKAVIHPSGDQDDTYAKYIKPSWPEIRYVETKGGVMISYMSQRTLSVDDTAYMSADWTKANIADKGPLGAFYRTWGDGRQMVKGDIFDYFGEAGKTAEQLRAKGYIVWSPVEAKGSAIGEGDTVTYLNLIDNGLEGYRASSFGGWGGYHDGGRSAMSGEMTANLAAVASGKAPEFKRQPTHPFLAQSQRDFAARFVWATTPRYADANHAPKIVLKGARLISAKPGQTVALAATVSDPDHDQVAVRWRTWPEAGTYAGEAALGALDGLSTKLVVPADAKPGDTLHIVAEASDDGAPALTRYAHIVVTVAK
ncbi:DUF1593 domain-containing protein [Caulobacter sp. 602-1]|nr:DUF1593 domain-containing protein [Caulobacter sp. 602-1]